MIDTRVGSAETSGMTEEELYRTLGENIAARRRALGKTQAEIATALGLSRASLANIERGRQKVLLHQVYRLATALDLGDVAKLLPIGELVREVPDRLPHGVPLTTQEPARATIAEPSTGLTARQRAQIEALFSKSSGTKGTG